jgi:hypothetical protein
MDADVEPTKVPTAGLDDVTTGQQQVERHAITIRVSNAARDAGW